MALQGTIGFLGYGNMGSAILEGLLAQRVVQAAQARAYDPEPARCEAARAAGAVVCASPEDLAAESDVLVLAVKPQTMDAALAPIRSALRPDTLIISIAAGIALAKLQACLGPERRMVRVMPNTPALVKAGAAGLALSANCTPADEAVALEIFGSIGIAVTVNEEDIDTVTALSGSGPAYFFYLAECLAEAAQSEGLDPEVSVRLAAQTLYGAGKLLFESGESAAVLRARVTSKGGTTEAALNQFRADGFAEVIRAGVRAAAARSRELGR